MINVSIDTRTVKEAKRELINQLKSKINQSDIETVCREKYGIELIEACECVDGDIIIDNNQVAYKLDFKVRFPLSILINNGENNVIALSDKDIGILSEFDNSREKIEPQEIDDTLDDELPDIEFEH
jgi:hypothetical protein